MHVIWKANHIILVAESEGEANTISDWSAGRLEHVFVLQPKVGPGIAFAQTWAPGNRLAASRSTSGARVEIPPSA